MKRILLAIAGYALYRWWNTEQNEPRAALPAASGGATAASSARAKRPANANK